MANGAAWCLTPLALAACGQLLGLDGYQPEGDGAAGAGGLGGGGDGGSVGGHGGGGAAGGGGGEIACGSLSYCASAMTCIDLEMDNQHCGACDHACIGSGDCSQGWCPPQVLATSGNAIHELAMDDAFLYWTETGAGIGAVWRVPKRGGTAELLADVEISAIDLALGENDVFFKTALGAGRVFRVPKTGGTATCVVDSQNGLVDMVYIDAQVFTLRTSSVPEVARFSSTTSNCGAATTHLSDITGTPQRALAGLSEIFISVATPNAILRVPTLGAVDETRFDDALPDEVKAGSALALDSAGTLFWLGTTHIRSKPTMVVGNSAIVVSGVNGSGLAVDEEFVYWSDEGTKQLRRAAKSGGGVAERIAAEPQITRYLLVDDDAIYWIGGSMVKRVDKP